MVTDLYCGLCRVIVQCVKHKTTIGSLRFSESGSNEIFGCQSWPEIENILKFDT